MWGEMDIDELDRELASPDFNAAALVNRLLPNEQSLSETGKQLLDLQRRQYKINSSIRDAVRDYSILGDRSDAILEETKTSVIDLSQKITKIHKQAKEAESVVGEICGGIKPLDNAKRNLHVSIQVLRHYQQIVTLLRDFNINIEKKDYGMCAQNMIALSDFFSKYNKYIKHPKFEVLTQRYAAKKNELRQEIEKDYEAMFNKGTADASYIPMCEAISAFGENFQESVTVIFCHKWLSMYENSFSNSTLVESKARFNWFKQRLDIYNKSYAEAFPKSWRMQYHLTLVFCQLTSDQFTSLLAAGEPNVKEYLQAFELTVKFEEKMATLFTQSVEVPWDPNAEMPAFGTDPDSVKAKYEWLQRQKEHRSETKLVAADEFYGSIAHAFAPYLQLYLDQEKKIISKNINTGVSNAKKEMDQDEHLLSSATGIVLNMKATIDKCSGFKVDDSLLKLFVMLKELLVKYVTSLTGALPKRPNKEVEYQLICCIANTSSFILSITDSLAEKISSIISEELRGGIVVDDVKESIGEELRKQLIYFADVFIKENETPLSQIGAASWTPSDADEKLPRKLSNSFEERFGVAQRWLSNDNMNRLRPAFISRIVGAVHDSFMKQKIITLDQASSISSELKDLKTSVSYWTRGDSTVAQKRINAEFAMMENELTIIISPEVAMAQVYLTKMKKPNKEHFQTLVRMKGLRGADEADAIASYDAEEANLKKH